MQIAGISNNTCFTSSQNTISTCKAHAYAHNTKTDYGGNSTLGTGPWLFLAQSMCLSTLLGTASPQPLRVSWSLAMAKFSVKVSLCLCGEGCMKLAHRSVLKQIVNIDWPVSLTHVWRANRSKKAPFYCHFERKAHIIGNLGEEIPFSWQLKKEAPFYWVNFGGGWWSFSIYV